jgi:hypothetical protein
VTVINSAIFWDMTKCNVNELPTFRGNAQLKSSRQNIVDGRVTSSDVVRGDLRSIATHHDLSEGTRNAP